ncbi:hypothetical protein SAMN05421636_106216 [Pricia antarctica]|uniref:TonB dependent receptor n=1 Tax=Pricia antarctica TaxID=641691 RepID=A0A1G7EJ94_9FLAO|nr:hypothetical protein [Pricia antarctica]SDE63753.1 hypothetical protein SAMN05421636_106216 [Pricia antarctica]
MKKNFSSRFNLSLGSEYFITDYEERFKSSDDFARNSGYGDQLWAGFVESDIFFSNRLPLKLGVRGKFSGLIEDFTLSPRPSLAYKSSEKGQFSLAYGDFYQTPTKETLRYDSSLNFEKASHYILNYQF